MSKLRSVRYSKNKNDLDYYVKHRYDYIFVIGDNKLKHDIEVIVGKRTFYCAFHDTRNSKHVCEDIRFIKI
jgi:hypothetical protein